MIHIRKFRNGDEQAVADVIAVTMRTVNIKDYPEKYIEDAVAFLNASKIKERSGWMHLYVVCDDDMIIGCGGIAPYWSKEDESIIFTVFVLPEYHGHGIGRSIIEAIEKDEIFLRARRIEVPASITALEFYRKMGYDYKDGKKEINEDMVYLLEKRREPAV